MAFDAFIQVAEIAGESQNEQYKHWIEILGYTFGTSQSTSATASSAGGRHLRAYHPEQPDLHQIPGQCQLQTA